MRRMHLVWLGAVWLVLPQAAQAQYPWGYWDYYTRASTPAEGYARGLGAIVRSAGQYNLMTSEAMINAEKARSMDLDNKLKQTQTYFEMRRLNREYREAERGPRYTHEDYVRWAQEGMPKQLSFAELDPITGRIHWPVALQSDAYAAHRMALEQIFARRASNNGALSLDDYLQVRQTTEAMLAILQENVRMLPPREYTYAKNFLQSLAFYANAPTS